MTALWTSLVTCYLTIGATLTLSAMKDVQPGKLKVYRIPMAIVGWPYLVYEAVMIWRRGK